MPVRSTNELVIRNSLPIYQIPPATRQCFLVFSSREPAINEILDAIEAALSDCDFIFTQVDKEIKPERASLPRSRNQSALVPL